MKKNDIKKKFIVGFYGTFIPLQGVRYIVGAAKELEGHSDILFKIIGRGQEYEEMLSMVKKIGIFNINFSGMVPFEDIPERIREFDICLGIFGDTNKTQRVIPNKVYEYVAIGKPVITSDTPAIRELFTDRENILLCKTADPEDMAEKILELKENKTLRSKIAENGYDLFIKKASPKVLVTRLLMDLKEVGVIDS